MSSSSQSPTTSQSSQSSQPQPQQQQQQSQTNANPFVHNVALGVTPIALIALFLPPRRLDMRAALLGGVALWGTNQLVYDYSGTSTLHRVGKRMQALSGTELPDKAKETQARLRAERERIKLREAAAAAASAGLSDDQKRLVEQQQQQKGERGLLKKVWMGDASDDWKEKRDQREKEALSEGGGGYWGLIVDQISEVWSGGKKKEDESRDVDQSKKS
ncbi:hypothetical protein M426DRAFT_317657 [Hypoxylon sp. CI-4A]|nr:hypothetical protein M426DRAFT_317657 [Hypoxylon sp. CI-4A]